MVAALYIIVFFALFLVGYFAAENPDSVAWRAMLYTLAFFMTVVLVYKLLGKAFGWYTEEELVVKKAPTPADTAQKEAGARAASDSTQAPGYPEVSVNLLARTLAHIQPHTPSAVHAEISDKIRKATKGDVVFMLALGRGFMFGDAYLRRDLKLAMI